MAKQLGNKSIKKEEKCPCLPCLAAVNSATEILNFQFDWKRYFSFMTIVFSEMNIMDKMKADQSSSARNMPVCLEVCLVLQNNMYTPS